jgi:hypothetical protein
MLVRMHAPQLALLDACIAAQDITRPKPSAGCLLRVMLRQPHCVPVSKGVL